MTSFVPLNIIPDSDSEGEVDNSEEIQIEEAIKLYARALKLHTDGALDEAHHAYEELFQSEIFQVDVEESVHARNRNVASSLPVIHHLSYKNHGAFKLDRLKARISTASGDEVQSEVSQALKWFAIALGRDAGDSSLWRETAQLALVVSSARLARFSLESLLDHNTVGADSSKDVLSLVSGANPNPEDRLALIQLRDTLEQIGDDVALAKPDIPTSRRKLKWNYAKFLRPLPWLPTPNTAKPLAVKLKAVSDQKEILNPQARTWSAVGKTILNRLYWDSESMDIQEEPPGTGMIQVVLPAVDGEEESRDTSPEETSPPASGEKSENAPVDDNDDVAMTDASVPARVQLEDRRRSGSAARKRKSTSMGADTTGSRLSKRQRDKKEAEAAAAVAASTPEGKKVRQETQDDKLFNTVDDCFSSFGISLGTADTLKIKPVLEDDSNENVSEKCEPYVDDFKTILQSWDDDKGNVILYGDGIQSPAEAAHGMRFLDLEPSVTNRPMLASDEGLRKWVKDLNSWNHTAQDAAIEWLKALCRRETAVRPGKKAKGRSDKLSQSNWVGCNWPDALKATAVNVARTVEEHLWRLFKMIQEDMATRKTRSTPDTFNGNDYADIEWAETILELYLDDLAAAERFQSEGEMGGDSEDELRLKRECVFRWVHLVGDLMHCRPRDDEGQVEEDQLTLRYLWANAVITGFADPSREFRLVCFEDLRSALAGRPAIDLPNSSIMPEVSSARAERELSKLKTVDFFSTIFMATDDANEKDPEEIIDILEAVLEPGDVLPYDDDEERILQEIARFLEGSSAMFRLHLWEKLKTAYEKINDVGKIFACTLQCMQIVMQELSSRSYLESSQDHRQFVLLRALRLMEGMVQSALDMMMQQPRCIEQLRDKDTTQALNTMMGLLRLLHCYSFWESAVQSSEAKASDLHSYRLVQVKFRDLLVRGWIMTYHLYSALIRGGLGCEEGGTWENGGSGEAKLARLLRDLHEELGRRHYCKLAHHMFLKLMFNEILRFDNRDLDGDLLQCLQCRFHLMLCSDRYRLDDHKTDLEPLDRPTALRLLDFVLYLASQKKVLQLAKSDLKSGLDRFVQVLGVPRRAATGRVFQNEAVIDQYLKSPIHPLKLMKCLHGGVTLSTVSIGGDSKDIAGKGLYFLQGKIALFPMRYQKRVGMVKADDLDTAIQYFKHDVVCNAENWETWYRIAQTFEIQMEEGQTWNADGINLGRSDLVALERRSILSYMMAASMAAKHADDSPQTCKDLAEMYSDFANRIYCASRPPMAMESFWVDGWSRHFSGRSGEGMYTARPHSEVSLEYALKAAFGFFQASISYGGDSNWKNHYMLGKCMGKLFKKWASYGKVNILPEQVLEKFVDAIAHCPEKNGNDYIFEPHHKLVSAATKFVLQGVLAPNRACEILQASHFARNITPATDRETFVQYAIEVLKKMKAADKPKWHHRMTNRLAQLRYKELGDVAGAKSEMSGLFSTKALQVSIWKPEFERPGRHFVFASQYTVFFANLLEQLQDRATLETLAKRVRKLSNGLFRHQDVWSQVFRTYINVLRTTGSIPDDNEATVFSPISLDEFTTYSARLDAFCSSTSPPPATLELLREVFELRKLNAALCKTPAIDDLLADTYAKLYNELVPEMMKQIKNPMNLKNLMFSEEATAAVKAGGRVAKVGRREVLSKASNLCKELNNAPVVAGVSATTTAAPTPKAVEIEERREEEDAVMEDGGEGDEADDEEEGNRSMITDE